ncbi:type II secretion system F family protein [Candidatus Uhrbacteria bacterium]|nr:type II secretion system F family protein [Candidatus Uhrbacteria bacterium]
MAKKKEEKPKRAVQKKSTGRRKVSLRSRLFVRLSHTERMLLTKYLAVLLRSGVAIDEALNILVQQSSGPLKAILNELEDAVKSGRTLADGMEQFPHVFSAVYINLIRAGESSGTLQANLNHLATQLQKQHELQQKVRGAMLYPMIVLAGAIVIGGFIFLFVLPKIIPLFQTLKVELPFTTRAILWTLGFVKTYPLYVLAGLFLLVLLFLVVPRIRHLRPITHWIILHMPVIRHLSRNINLARFTRLMGTLLASGMPINDALTITRSVLKNFYFRRLFESAQAGVSRGKTLTDILESMPHLVPPMAIRLVRVGEETGTLPEMLDYLAQFYEQEVDDSVRNISSLIEPVMILSIGVFVGILAYSIISPIYQVVGSI